MTGKSPVHEVEEEEEEEILIEIQRKILITVISVILFFKL
jgi:hypothetical protein